MFFHVCNDEHVSVWASEAYCILVQDEHAVGATYVLHGAVRAERARQVRPLRTVRCYGESLWRIMCSKFNPDLNAWKDSAAKRPQPDTRPVPNGRNLHPANDWANLAIQRHLIKDPINPDGDPVFKPTKKQNPENLLVNADLPPFMLSSVGSPVEPAANKYLNFSMRHRSHI